MNTKSTVKDTSNDTKPFYQEDILEMYKNPSHKGLLSNPNASVIKENSLCGDSLSLTLNIDRNTSVITDAKFDGESCLVSVVSSEIFLEDIIGKTVDYAKNITKDDLLNMLNLNLTTSRIKCATLILNAFSDAIKKYEESL